MSRRRLVLIGAGAIGRMHVERARTHAQCEIVAVADPSPQAEDFALEQGLRWFADYRSMLDAVKPEGAVVATPNAVHAAVALDRIARAVPMLMEKPVADTVEQAQQLDKAAVEVGAPLLVGHHEGAATPEAEDASVGTYA